MKIKKLFTPLLRKQIHNFEVGDFVEITGDLIVARDQAHQRIKKIVEAKKKLPINFKNTIIFYAGPTPAKPGEIIGAIGPTTSKRMDCFTKLMINLGVSGFIGKGNRSIETMSLIKNNALYFVTFGGYAALLSQFVVKYEIIAFPELGPEALQYLSVKNFPVIVWA